MKKIVAITLGLCLLGMVSVSQAQEHKKKEMTEEQKKIVEKYDTNKDGKLDKDEYAKVSSEDKEKLPKRGGKKKEAAATEEKK